MTDLHRSLRKARKALEERDAKARLSDMVVQEVSVVDAAANMRRFPIAKSERGGDRLATLGRFVVIR